MKSTNLIIGTRHNAKDEREKDDFYATHPQAVRIFLNKLKEDNVILNNTIWEPACGQGHMAEAFIEYGYKVYASDLIDRGYGEITDFLEAKLPCKCDIFTNPPFKLAEEFISHGLEILEDKDKLGLFVKIQFLEGKSRKKIFDKYPPKYIYIYSGRQQCSKNADFEHLKCTTVAYIWIMWEKGFKGETTTRWI